MIVKVGDLVLKEDVLYRVESEIEITDVRDGNPFTYPGLLLKRFEGTEFVTIPKVQASILLVHNGDAPVVKTDQYDEFITYMEDASNVTLISKLRDKKEHLKFKKNCSSIVDSYVKRFHKGRVSENSREMLNSFVYNFLFNIEFSFSKKKEKETSI